MTRIFATLVVIIREANPFQKLHDLKGALHLVFVVQDGPQGWTLEFQGFLGPWAGLSLKAFSKVSTADGRPSVLMSLGTHYLMVLNLSLELASPGNHYQTLKNKNCFIYLVMISIVFDCEAILAVLGTSFCFIDIFRT